MWMPRYEICCIMYIWWRLLFFRSNHMPNHMLNSNQSCQLILKEDKVCDDSYDSKHKKMKSEYIRIRTKKMRMKRCLSCCQMNTISKCSTNFFGNRGVNGYVKRMNIEWIDLEIVRYYNKIIIFIQIHSLAFGRFHFQFRCSAMHSIRTESYFLFFLLHFFSFYFICLRCTASSQFISCLCEHIFIVYRFCECYYIDKFLHLETGCSRSYNERAE